MMRAYMGSDPLSRGGSREKAEEFIARLHGFIDRDEHILCEIIRMDATKKLLQRRYPELLKMASNPAAEMELYRVMKEASAEISRFLIRPFPGDSLFFHELFEIFNNFSDAKEFLATLIRAHMMKSTYLPVEVCDKAFEEAGSSHRIKVVEPDLFFSCLFYKLEDMKDREIYLYPVHSTEKGVELFLKYMLRDHSGVRYVEKRDSEVLEKGDYVILSAVPRRMRLRMLIPLTRKIRMIKEAPEGVRFFLAVPGNFLSSLEMADAKALLASYRIEKIYLWSGIRIRDLGAVLLTKEPAEEYTVEVIEGEKRITVDSNFLKNVPVWTSDFLFSEEKEEILKFFLSGEKVKLEDVAEVRRGYFIRKRGEATDEKDAPRILSVGDIDGAFIEPNKLSSVKLAREEKMIPLKPGDIVISARGTVMKVAVVPPTDLKIYPTDSVIVISPIDYPSNLLRFFLSTPVGMKLLMNARRSGPLLSILASDVKKIPVPVVSPEERMKELDAKLKKAEEDYIKKVRRAEEEYRSRIKEIEKELFEK